MARILIRNATIVSMDEATGDLTGDLLVENDRISAIAPTLAAGDAEVVDASGFIVIPGLINAHMHTWQTGLRGVAAPRRRVDHRDEASEDERSEETRDDAHPAELRVTRKGIGEPGWHRGWDLRWRRGKKRDRDGISD